MHHMLVHPEILYFTHIEHFCVLYDSHKQWQLFLLILNLPMTTIVAQPFNVIKWQLKFNPVA